MMNVSEDAFYVLAAGKTYRLSKKKQRLAKRVKDVFYLHRRGYRAEGFRLN
jgi:hypothetical protein